MSDPGRAEHVVKGDVQGFAGCYDVWHFHETVCIDNQGRITLTEPHSAAWYSDSECRAPKLFDGYYPKHSS